MQKLRIFLILGVVLIFAFFVCAFFYFALVTPRVAANQEILKNPVEGLSTEDAIKEFNESFVSYLLYSIKAYNLHSPPLSKDEPRIQFFIDENSYQARIISGKIIVERGDITDEDIVIKTTRPEAVLMLQNKSYIQSSFSSGLSSIELIASKTTLFGKGYLNLYTELTGKSVTGNVVRIYTA